tara:strand:- start:488 stop:730 length:243 start_codon:yes stop_codon:yes gene_type:complete
MAEVEDKWEDNTPGKFYVDKECILCSVCEDVAPSNFKVSEEGEYDICFKQPDGEEELSQCYTALAECPVDAIGDDGQGEA